MAVDERQHETTPSWWDRATVAAVLRDLLAETWQRLRPASTPPDVFRAEAPAPAPAGLADVRLDESGLGADSLERLQLATATATFFRLYETGVEDALLMKRTLGGWLDLIEESLGECDASLGFTTGGTTGEPRIIEHRLDDLWREARVLAGLCRDRERVAGLVPRHHIYGFIWTVLLPRALDVPAADLRGGTPAGVGRKLRSGDLVVAIPDIWRLVGESGARWPANVDGVTATAPCPASTARAAAQRAVRRLFEIYGSTETGGIGWRVEPGMPYTLLDHWHAAADSDRLTAERPDGTELTVTVPDSLEWRDAGHFTVGGRRDGMVQVAGTNVDPERVRGVLESHPEVAEAAVRPMTAAEGDRLKAFIVPTRMPETPHALGERVAAHAEARLTAPEQPRAIRVGNRIPRTGMDKLADWPVADPDADPVGPGS